MEESIKNENIAFTEGEKEPFELHVKYDHKDMTLSEEDARSLSQKGLNYDRLMEKYESLRNDEGLLYLDDLSSSLGFSGRDELIADIKKNGEKAFPSDNEIRSFFEKNPDVSPSDIPESVLKAVSSGVPLELAFEKEKAISENERLSKEVSLLQKELSDLKLSEKNKASSPGSMLVGGAMESDIYGEEELSALSGAEISKNLDKALRSMTFWTQKRR